ncbi:MAG TPA: universal stress protein [Syntrophorhabdaceae bacterium]
MPTRILVPTDFSEYSDKALEQALDIAKEYKAKVFLFHVIHEEPLHPIPFVDTVLEKKVLEMICDQARVEAEQRMRTQLEKFPQTKEVEVVTGIRRGIAYEEILKEAEDNKVDLIVIGSLGRTAIAKYFIGSVARNVLKGATCNVLLAK